MADIQSILKPRRGKKSVMTGSKKGIVLENGEFFIEAPNTGVGTGHSRAKVGDGSTSYETLPYAWGDTENDLIAFTENTSTTVDAALNSVVSGGKLKNLIAGLKQAIVQNKTSITKLNDDKITAVIEDGKVTGIKIGGADTVYPFKKGGLEGDIKLIVQWVISFYASDASWAIFGQTDTYRIHSNNDGTLTKTLISHQDLYPDRYFCTALPVDIRKSFSVTVTPWT